jgi:tetratricopeptide (TPR) repeat protein
MPPPAREGQSPGILIQRIEEGANADHLKYRFLMKTTPRSVDRDAILVLVRQSLKEERDTCRKLLLESVLAFGLTRGRDDAARREGAGLYLSLLKDRAWPPQMEQQRERTCADFKRAADAVKFARDTHGLVAAMFRDYLSGRGGDHDSVAFADLMAATEWNFNPLGRVIDEMTPQCEKDAVFWMRLGSVYLARKQVDRATPCFEKAWGLDLGDDGQIKRAGHGLVDCYLAANSSQEAVKIQEAILVRLAVKDDYLCLARVYARVSNREGVRAAVAKQLSLMPTPQTRVEAAALCMDAKLYGEVLATLDSVPRSIDKARDRAEQCAVFAAAVLRLRHARLTCGPQAEEAAALIRDNRTQFQALAGEQEWLLPYYREGVSLLRLPSRTTKAPSRQENEP